MTIEIPYGRQIKTVRAIRGWAQHDLAHVSGVTRDTIARIETTHRASSRTKRLIETAFGLAFDAPAVQAAFAVLANDAARADQVRLALAILEPGSEHQNA